MKSVLVGPLPPPSLVGDAAISLGAVALLRGEFASARIHGWSDCVDPEDEHSLRLFRDAYGVDSVTYSPWSLAPEVRVGHQAPGPVAQLGTALRKLAVPPLARVRGTRALRLLATHSREFAQAMSEADLVIMRGGGYLSSPHLWCDMIHLRLNALNELVLARSLRVPYALWGHTIWDLKGPLSRQVLWPLIRDSAATICREQRTYDYLLSAGAARHRLAVLPDTAFAVPAATHERAVEILHREGLDDAGRAVVGINIRPLSGVRRDHGVLTGRYMQALMQLLNTLIRGLDLRVLLIPHGYQTHSHSLPTSQDDRAVHEQVLRSFEDTGRCQVLAGNYTPSELVALYGSLCMIVTTRLHLGILAAVAGTPSVLVSYEGTKTHGTAAMLGLDDMVVDVGEISAERLISAATDLLVHRDARASDLASRMHEIRQRLAEYAPRTLAGAGLG